MGKRKSKFKKPSKQVYKVMWSYYDSIGTHTGVVDIEAPTREEAEKEFYKINRNYITGFDGKSKKPIYNPKGGYVCESVLTEREWIAEGRPTSV